METAIETRSPSVAVVRFRGRLDFLSAANAREQFTAAIAAGQHKLIVDLAETTFIDSSGLGALVAGLKAARQASGDLRLARLPEQAASVLKLTSLDRVFHSYSSIEDAVATY